MTALLFGINRLSISRKTENDLLLLNVGQERISAIAWTENGSPKDLAFLDPGNCQRVADMFSFIYSAPATVTISFDYPSGKRWATQVGWNKGGAEELHWLTRPL